MRTSIAAAGATAVATKGAAITTLVTTINAARCDVGYLHGFPTGNATYVAAVQSAAKALADTRAAAEMAKLASITVAKDLLRSQGEIPF
jgi:hypothetical protein